MEWAVTRYHDLILLNIHRGRWTEPEVINLMVDLQVKSGYNNRSPHIGVVVEDNGVGLPTLQGMQARGLPAYGVHVSENKIAMSATAAIRMEVGSIFFPLTGTKELNTRYPFMEEFIKEMIYFPSYTNDDQITALSLGAQAVFETGIGGLGGTARVEVTDRKMVGDALARSTGHKESKEGPQAIPGMAPTHTNGEGNGRMMYGSRRS
jgi:predicted phage terminase large subunit-like protein